MRDDVGAGASPGSGVLIAHRGASGYRPENTLEAFELARSLGADSLELDVVPTADGHLIVRHESELSETTDVADRAEFAHRRTTKTIDDVVRSGWFSEDFTRAEIKTLRARERMRVVRSANARFDGHYQVPTLERRHPRSSSDELSRPSPVIADAHGLGLLVLGWTFRREKRYLPARFRVGTNPYGPGDTEGELTRFRSAGMDGFFVDQPDVDRSHECP